LLHVKLATATGSTAAAIMDGDDVDALLLLAVEADDATEPSTASKSAPAARGLTTADNYDALLGLADAICTADTAQTATTAQLPCQRQNTDTVSRPAVARPALCSTRAFSAATPGSSRSSRQGSGPGNISSSTTAVPRQQQEVQHYVEKLTGLKIKLPRVSGVVLKERYRAVTCVPVSKAP
jgi:hypothetical protein